MHTALIYLKKVEEDKKQLIKALEDIMGWALQSVAKGNKDADILPRGYDKWIKLLDDVK